MMPVGNIVDHRLSYLAYLVFNIIRFTAPDIFISMMLVILDSRHSSRVIRTLDFRKG